MRLSWGFSSGIDATGSMPDSRVDDLPSLSATCPTSQDVSEDTKVAGSLNASEPIDSNSDVLAKTTSRQTGPKVKDTAVRSAKREISDKVREDWEWPPLASGTEGLPDSVEDAREWRERESDSDYQPPSPIINADPYRFDSPDSLAQAPVSRKRKRQKMFEEEMEWNDGLRAYHERRNAWAGAKTETQPVEGKDDLQESTQLPTPPSAASDPPLESDTPSTTILIPVAPPILPPDNPIRASIQPATYYSIYEKIIIRGLSPTIPINLEDVVHTLVAGWKKDGEWPPKSEAEKAGIPDDGGAIGARGGGKRLARRSVGRVKRVLGLGRGIDDPGRGERQMEE